VQRPAAACIRRHHCLPCRPPRSGPPGVSSRRTRPLPGRLPRCRPHPNPKAHTAGPVVAARLRCSTTQPQTASAAEPTDPTNRPPAVVGGSCSAVWACAYVRRCGGGRKQALGRQNRGSSWGWGTVMDRAGPVAPPVAKAATFKRRPTPPLSEEHRDGPQVGSHSPLIPPRRPIATAIRAQAAAAAANVLSLVRWQRRRAP